MNGYGNQPLHVALSCTVPPASEPVTVDEAKAWARVELDFTTDDPIFESLIAAARSFAQVKQGRQLMPATYLLRLDQFPLGGFTWWNSGPALIVPYPKLRSVTSIVYTSQSGQSTTLDPSRYLVDTISQPGRITPTFSQPWPATRVQAGSVAITYVAGYADAAEVPDTTKTAMKLLINHWYRNREAVGNVGGPLAMAVDALLACDTVAHWV